MWAIFQHCWQKLAIPHVDIPSCHCELSGGLAPSTICLSELREQCLLIHLRLHPPQIVSV
eukprot:3764828-Pyramimonas_sp.AAC.1